MLHPPVVIAPRPGKGPQLGLAQPRAQHLAIGHPPGPLEPRRRDLGQHARHHLDFARARPGPSAGSALVHCRSVQAAALASPDRRRNRRAAPPRPLSCGGRGHDPMIARPVAINPGRGPRPGCNQCGHDPPMIARRAADDCSSLQLLGVRHSAHASPSNVRMGVVGLAWSGLHQIYDDEVLHARGSVTGISTFSHRPRSLSVGIWGRTSRTERSCTWRACMSQMWK